MYLKRGTTLGYVVLVNLSIPIWEQLKCISLPNFDGNFKRQGKKNHNASRGVCTKHVRNDRQSKLGDSSTLTYFGEV